MQRVKDKDRSTDDPNSPRNVINTFYYKAPFTAEREEDFLTSSLHEKMGDDKYPGDMTPSTNWPNIAPGKLGPINAMSPKYYDTSSISESAHKPPILWVRGDQDLITSNNSMFDFGALGKLEYVPGWPGDDVYPPQPMIGQMRYVLDKYQVNGGQYREVVIADAAHAPHIEKPDEFNVAFHQFLQDES